MEEEVKGMFQNTGEQSAKTFHIPSFQETHLLCSEEVLFRSQNLLVHSLVAATKTEALSFSPLPTLTFQTAFELEVRLTELKKIKGIFLGVFP